MWNRLRRRAPKLSERITPCAACEYPFSQRHHLDPVRYSGENNDTVQLCANCHELYHILDRLNHGGKSTSDIHAGHAYITKFGWEDKAYRFLEKLAGAPDLYNVSDNDTE